MTNFNFSDSDDETLNKDAYETQILNSQQYLNFNNKDYYQELEKIRISCAQLKNEEQQAIETEAKTQKEKEKPQKPTKLFKTFDKDPVDKLYILIKQFTIDVQQLKNSVKSENSQRNIAQLLELIQTFNVDTPFYIEDNYSHNLKKYQEQPLQRLFFDDIYQAFSSKKNTIPHSISSSNYQSQYLLLN